MNNENIVNNNVINAVPNSKNLSNSDHNLFSGKVENTDQSNFGKILAVAQASLVALEKTKAFGETTLEDSSVAVNSEPMATPESSDISALDSLAPVIPEDVPTQTDVITADTSLPVQIGQGINDLNQVPNFVPIASITEPQPVETPVALEESKFGIVDESANVPEEPVQVSSDTNASVVPDMEEISAVEPSGVNEDLFIQPSMETVDTNETVAQNNAVSQEQATSVNYEELVNNAKQNIIDVIEKEFSKIKDELNVITNSKSADADAINETVKSGIEKINSTVANNVIQFPSAEENVVTDSTQTEEVPISIGM